MPPEIDLLSVRRGSVTAPAGCGKTQLITDNVALHAGEKPILILTHTNAGAGALRIRLKKAEVSSSTYTVTTIDAFCIRLIGRFPARSGHKPDLLELANLRTDYPAIRTAAVGLARSGHLSEIFDASYAGLIVDEYQDCDLLQHAFVEALAEVLPTCVLGDPMQAIFTFAGPTVDWGKDVLPQFPMVGELKTPWRWQRAGTERLGQWLLEARQLLADGKPIDLKAAPPEVCWVKITPAEANQQRVAASSTRAITSTGDVLVIGPSMNRNQRYNLASRTPGATVVEAVDLIELTQFGVQFDVRRVDALQQLLSFTGEVMTGVGAPNLLRRLETIQGGRSRTAISSAEQAALNFKRDPSWGLAAQLMSVLVEQPEARVFRPEILHCCLSAMHSADTMNVTFEEATKQVRERNRHVGRRLSRRAVGSTLLLKGLEAEVGVILHPEEMNACNLYVALTRGAKKVVVCSSSQYLTPR
jgi:DNA helicase-2/ATP-dependent DNA helicase PcrA